MSAYVAVDYCANQKFPTGTVLTNLEIGKRERHTNRERGRNKYIQTKF